MQKSCGIITSQDSELVKLCQEIGDAIGLVWTVEHKIADFLLKLQDRDFRVLLFDCELGKSDCLQWITLLRKMRPRIPLIAMSDQVDPKTNAKFLEQGVFFHCIRPVDEQILREVLSAALKWMEKRAKSTLH